MTKFDCTSCQDAMADCLDAETQPTGDLAAHLAECTACAAAWSQLQQAWSLLRPEGLALSAEAQSRVLAYAAAHAPGVERVAEAAPSRPIGRRFWAAFALALALVVWKVGSVPEPTRAAPPEAAKMAQVEPAPAAAREPLPAADGEARSVALEEAAPAGPSPAAEVAAVDEKQAPRSAERPSSASALVPRASERAEVSKAKAEMAQSVEQAPKMAASAAARAPRLRAERQMEDAIGGEVGAASDSVAGMAAAPDADEAAAPTVRAAAPAGRAAEREARAVAAAPVVAGGSQPSAVPSLDTATRAALDTLLRAGGSGAEGWSQLRAAAVASSLRGFEALLASCGADTHLCDGAALGAGALRAASRRADATPLLQRAARSEVGAVASAARRLLAGP